MDELNFHGPSISEALYAQIIGREVIRYIRDHTPDALAPSVESEAIRLLEEIRQILDDPVLEDSTCFMRIDEIVSAFLRSGISVDRHDF